MPNSKMSTKVVTSAAVLSNLFYQHSNSKGDQEGLLLGEVISHITDTISDSQIQNIKEEKSIYIHSFVPCHGLFSFYDSCGKINTEKLSAITGDREKEVIGWFKFRRNSSIRASLRESIIHQQLSTMFRRHDTFVFGLFTSSLTANMSTHSNDHSFFYYRNRCFHPFSISIENLGDTTHTRYKLSCSTNLGLYKSSVENHRSHCLDKSGKVKEVANIQRLSDALHKQLQHLKDNLISSEQSLSQLSAEVSKLRTETGVEETNMETEVSLIDWDTEIPVPVTPPSVINKPLPKEPIENEQLPEKPIARKPLPKVPKETKPLPEEPKVNKPLPEEPIQFIDDDEEDKRSDSWEEHIS